ncbi:hypothetical protein GCK72_022314 [Caenorhabditis remanei]|uniref:SAM domain-containing protein n=1 Tax=Caenorhabditis remanei TaxID=31234 RepID=A0A6A5FTF4_CAERE|nr:hypothetical protein GCK72_022314 [Caenorhabditis remanei]KAF1745867.1 hypothetical protein GCK72_022314 [Caenorhabditis remanei]
MIAPPSSPQTESSTEPESPVGSRAPTPAPTPAARQSSVRYSTCRPTKKRLTEADRLREMDFGPKEGGKLGGLEVVWSTEKRRRTTTPAFESPARNVLPRREAEKKKDIDDTGKEETKEEDEEIKEEDEDKNTPGPSNRPSTFQVTRKREITSVTDGNENGANNPKISGSKNKCHKDSKSPKTEQSTARKNQAKMLGIAPSTPRDQSESETNPIDVVDNGTPEECHVPQVHSSRPTLVARKANPESMQQQQQQQQALEQQERQKAKQQQQRPRLAHRPVRPTELVLLKERINNPELYIPPYCDYKYNNWTPVDLAAWVKSVLKLNDSDPVLKKIIDEDMDGRSLEQFVREGSLGLRTLGLNAGRTIAIEAAAILVINNCSRIQYRIEMAKYNRQMRSDNGFPGLAGRPGSPGQPGMPGTKRNSKSDNGEQLQKERFEAENELDFAQLHCANPSGPFKVSQCWTEILFSKKCCRNSNFLTGPHILIYLQNLCKNYEI